MLLDLASSQQVSSTTSRYKSTDGRSVFPLTAHTTTLDLCNELLDIAKCRGDSQAERGQLGMRRVTKQRHIPLTYSFV